MHESFITEGHVRQVKHFWKTFWKSPEDDEEERFEQKWTLDLSYLSCWARIRCPVALRKWPAYSQLEAPILQDLEEDRCLLFIRKGYPAMAPKKVAG